MSNYVRSKSIEIAFDGDSVKAVVSPLTFIDCARALQIVSGKIDDHAAVSQMVSELLPRYVKSLTGLRDAGGTELTVEDVATDMYFTKLAAELIKECVAISMPKDPSKPGESR